MNINMEQQQVATEILASRQSAYQKLDEAFGGLGENISTRGVDETTIQNICDAETPEEVREIWGQYVHGKIAAQFSRRAEETLH